MKVVINTCYGGFGLSKKALEMYSVLKYGENLVEEDKGFYSIKNGADEITEYNIERDDPFLVKVVEELGKEANSDFSKLRVKEIPDGSEWEIEEQNGNERLRKPVTYY